MDILVIDVGGTSVKLWHTAHEEHLKFDSGPDMTPEEMARGTKELAATWEFEAVALGLPCRVSFGRPVDEPTNLGPGWVGFNFSSSLGRPVRVMNDACLQALGSYDGGRMLFLGIGTGLGSAFIAEGLVLSLDLGQAHWDDRRLWEVLNTEYIEAADAKERRKLIKNAISELRAMLMADYVVIGGGGAKLLEGSADASVRRGHNRTVVEGGRRLWEELPDPADKNLTTWVIR
jgi:predicted NBD/HSP70 family sugar kinase